MSTEEGPRRNPPRTTRSRTTSQASSHERTSQQDNRTRTTSRPMEEEAEGNTAETATDLRSQLADAVFPPLPRSTTATPRTMPGGLPDNKPSTEEETVRIDPPRSSLPEDLREQRLWTHTDSYVHPITEERVAAIGRTSTLGPSSFRRTLTRDTRVLSVASSTANASRSSRYPPPSTSPPPPEGMEIRQVLQSPTGSEPAPPLPYLDQYREHQ